MTQNDTAMSGKIDPGDPKRSLIALGASLGLRFDESDLRAALVDAGTLDDLNDGDLSEVTGGASGTACQVSQSFKHLCPKRK